MLNSFGVLEKNGTFQKISNHLLFSKNCIKSKMTKILTVIGLQ